MRNINLISELAKKDKTFTVNEALSISNVSRSIMKKILYRLVQKGSIERIEKGKYLIIPLGAEKGKYTLNEFVIGSLLVKPYCIAYWSALHHYGLTEQIPNTVFLQTTSRKKKQETDILGVKYKIIKVKSEKFFGIRKEWIDESQVDITDKEKTIIDCLDKPQYCGGIVEVAKALKNIGNLDKSKLSKYAQEIGNSGVLRRLGYLCESLGIDITVPSIETRNYLLLDPIMPHKGSRNAKWRLIINLNKEILNTLE